MVVVERPARPPVATVVNRCRVVQAPLPARTMTVSFLSLMNYSAARLCFLMLFELLSNISTFFGHFTY